MANGPFNAQRGSWGYLFNDTQGLAGANSRLVVVVLEAAEADDVLNNYTDLGALIAAAGNTEWAAAGYARKQIAAAGVTMTVDNTANSKRAIVDADQTWTAVTGNPSQKLLNCYDADNAVGTDADIVPVTHHDWAVTPNGGDITANYSQTDGFVFSA